MFRTGLSLKILVQQRSNHQDFRFKLGWDILIQKFLEGIEFSHTFILYFFSFWRVLCVIMLCSNFQLTFRSSAIIQILLLFTILFHHKGSTLERHISWMDPCSRPSFLFYLFSSLFLVFLRLFIYFDFWGFENYQTLSSLIFQL